MPKSPIDARLDALRSRTHQVLGIHGSCWLVAVMVGIATVCGLTDWMLDLTTGVRALLLAMLVCASAWTIYRMLLVPFSLRLRDVDLALRVEEQFPSLNDQLASAVEFSHEPPDSERSGSAALRRAVVEQTARRVVAIEFGDALDWRSTQRAMAAAATILVVAIGIVLAGPGSARIAIARLVNPFGPTAWPRETHLALVNAPERLARGEAFQLTVQVARGRVPDRAEIYYEFEGGETAKDPLRPHSDRQFTGGLEAVTRSFDYYVRAGDGLTEPKHVLVVPPPELESLKVRLTYPAYTGQPPQDLPHDKGQVRAVWGTQVELTARSSKPLASAELRMGTDQIVPATLSSSGTELHASFKLEETGSYWVSMQDREGFQNRDASRYELRAIDDLTPDVFIERPASDIEVTPTADVPLRIVVKDDFGIQDVELHHTGSTPDATTDVRLWGGDDRPRRHIIDHSWHLAELGLTAGASVSYRVTARDADDLRGPHVGQSRQLRLLVVTPEELARRLEDKQLLIYQELERIRKIEVDARQLVKELREQLENQPTLSKSDLAHLQAAETLQRQVQRRITSPSEGLQNQIKQLQQDLTNNHITNSAVNEQMEVVDAGLDRVAREDLPQIEQNISRARKAAEEEANEKNPQRPELAEAQKHQDSVVATLDDMLERLSKWETYRGIARDVRELVEQQERLGKETQEIGRETIGKSRESLPPDAQAQLSKLAGRQEQARDQLGRVQRKMEQMGQRLSDNDPIGSEALRDAVDSSRQAGTAEQMQKAAASVAQNQVGAAEAAQRQATEDLKQMLDTLENNRERDLAKIIEKLKQAEAKLSDLRQRQAEQLQRTKEAQDKKDSDERRRELEKLARQEKELQQETARLAQQLRRLKADQAGKTSSSAAGKMQQAGQQMEQGDGEQAQADEEKVLEELEKAQKEVAQARKEAEAQLAMEQLAKIADTLVALHTREKTLKEETVRLDKERQQKGNWTRPQLASLNSATETQKTVREETEKAKEALTSAPVFALTLARAIGNMERAIERLGAKDANTETQAAQQAAIDRFAQLLDALKSEPGQKAEQSGEGEGGGQQGGPPRDGIPPIAQLKMLRSLQVEINERTGELGDLLDREKKLLPAQQKELESLGIEQGTLADLVRGLMQPAEEGENP